MQTKRFQKTGEYETKNDQIQDNVQLSRNWGTFASMQLSGLKLVEHKRAVTATWIKLK